MEIAVLPPKRVVEALSHSTMKVLRDFGESVPEAVLFHLQKIMNVPAKAVFEDPIRFAESLEKVFSAGTPLVEERIIQSMCAELHIDYEDGPESFHEKIRRICEKEGPKRSFQLEALEQSMNHQ